MEAGMDCPYCSEFVKDLEYLYHTRCQGEFDCPHCGKPLRVVSTDEGYWLVGNLPEDQAMRAAGAPMLPGLE